MTIWLKVFNTRRYLIRVGRRIIVLSAFAWRNKFSNLLRHRPYLVVKLIIGGIYIMAYEDEMVQHLP